MRFQIEPEHRENRSEYTIRPIACDSSMKCEFGGPVGDAKSRDDRNKVI